jgi:hypothetical protein
MINALYEYAGLTPYLFRGAGVLLLPDVDIDDEDADEGGVCFCSLIALVLLLFVRVTVPSEPPDA